MIIFKAKTNDAHHFKVLSELLSHNLKTACFRIDKRGISLGMFDTPRIVLLLLKLEAENFSLYKFKGDKEGVDKILIGINMNHFQKMLKNIKKKDSIELFIDSDEREKLGIRVIPKENNRVSTSFITIQNIQNIDMEFPTGYGTKPIVVSSSEYQKMCKEIKTMGHRETKIRAGKYHINFDCNAGDVMKCDISLGEFDEESDSDDEDGGSGGESGVVYEDLFYTEHLIRILKISGLSNNIQIYPGKKDELPLLLKSRVGDIGSISVYLKSNSIIEADDGDESEGGSESE